MTKIERTFAQRLRKQRWHAYVDPDLKIVVVNVYTHKLKEEQELIERVTGMRCKVVQSFSVLTVLTPVEEISKEPK